VAARWRLDEVVTNVGRPSELFYLVRIRKSTSKDDLLTAVRAAAEDSITDAQLEVADSVAAAEEDGDKR
jgi:hypothetical protein